MLPNRTAGIGSRGAAPDAAVPSPPAAAPVPGSDAARGAQPSRLGATPVTSAEGTRGSRRAGPDRVLTDRAFTAVTRTICNLADGTSVEVVDATACPPADATAAQQAGAALEDSGDDLSDPMTTAIGAEQGLQTYAAGTTANTGAGIENRVHASRPPRAGMQRVAPLQPVARPHGQQARQRHRGLGRSVLLGMLLAVAVIAMTLDLLGRQDRPSRGGDRENAEAQQEARRPQQ